MNYTIKQYLFKLVLSFLVLSNFLGGNEALAQRDPVEPEPKAVSLIQLISNPIEFDGKLVRVIGYCRLDFEGDALYLHREDYEYVITKNAVWLDIGNLMSASSPNLSNKYVIVEGVFDSTDKGHLGLYSGCIKEIRRLDHWRANQLLEKNRKKKKGKNGVTP